MTSRICIKGLPKHLNEQRLKEHFEEKGAVTDAKVIRARDGTSRQFGFIGYRTVEEAESALKYYNRTFLDTSRITVEFAYEHGSEQLSRPWSKYSEGSSAHLKQIPKPAAVAAKTDKKTKKRKGVEAEEEDPQLLEFLKVMAPRAKGAIWSNDDIVPTAALPVTKASKPSARGADAADDMDADELYEDLPKQHSAAVDGDDSSAESSDGEASEDESEGMASDKDAVVVDEGVSDLDYLKSRMKPKLDVSKDDDMGSDESEGDEEQEEEDESDADARQLPAAQSLDGHREPSGHVSADDMSDDGDGGKTEGNDDDEAERDAPNGPAQPAAECEPETVEADDAPKIADTGRLFVRNLAYSTTEGDLAESFGQFGELSEVHLVVDRVTKQSKAIALVQFLEPQDAVAAHAALDRSIFQGRLLHILPARPQPAARAAAAEAADGAEPRQIGTLKAQREEEKKAQAGNRAAWNTLFMRADTVAEAVAQHYGISKAELLDRDAADLPARMALGETHVIALTKKSLGEAGVSVEALEEAASASGKASATKSVARSSNTLLVKNLPFACVEGELEELFGKFGTLERLVLPATRTLALVQFQEATDARRAFKGLAYKKFHHVPIYLEWAPKEIFRPDAPKTTKPGAATPGLTFVRAGDTATPADAAPGAVVGTAGAEPVVVVADVAEVADDAAESLTIYVKNLSFATHDDGLKKHFDAILSAAGGHIRSVKVAKKKGPDGKPLSMGFGFVECSSEDIAKETIRKLQGSILDGHKLVLQLSLRKSAAEPAAAKQKASTKAAEPQGTAAKLVVRNVAFEAVRKDVMTLFGPFGHIKSCRLPRKFDGSHRGFAFVEFLSQQEARNAREAVAGAHLYGRRLTVEWAEAEDGLDELRARAAAQYHGGPATLQPSKRVKYDSE